MKQFDVVANPFPRSRERQPFLVTLQSDLLVRSLDTVVVAPLEPALSSTSSTASIPASRWQVSPSCSLRKSSVTVRKSALGSARGSVAGERDAIVAALDLLFTESVTHEKFAILRPQAATATQMTSESKPARSARAPV